MLAGTSMLPGMKPTREASASVVAVATTRGSRVWGAGAG
jgi:hypothetical protein